MSTSATWPQDTRRRSLDTGTQASNFQDEVQDSCSGVQNAQVAACEIEESKHPGLCNQLPQPSSPDASEDDHERTNSSSIGIKPEGLSTEPPGNAQASLAEQVAKLSVAIESLVSHMKEDREARKLGKDTTPAPADAPSRSQLSQMPLDQFDTKTATAMDSVTDDTIVREFGRYFKNHVIDTVVFDTHERRRPKDFPKLYLCRSEDSPNLIPDDDEVPEVFDSQNEDRPHSPPDKKQKDLVKALDRVQSQWPVYWEDITRLNDFAPFGAKENNIYSPIQGASTGSISYLAINQASPVLSLKQIACIAWSLLHGMQLPEELKDRSLDLSKPCSAVMEFICYFCRPSHDCSRFMHTFGSWNVLFYRPAMGQLHFSMRSLVNLSESCTVGSKAESGLSIDREEGSLVLDPGSKIKECRMSFLLLARYPTRRTNNYMTDRPRITKFNLLKLSDSFDHGVRQHRLSRLTKDKLSDYNMIHCGQFWQPVVAFIACFMAMLPDWHKSWMTFLDTLDSSGTQTISVQSLLHREQLRKMLFDSSSTHAESHFQILNLLRLASYWIRQTQEDWRNLRIRTMVTPYSERDRVAGFWRSSESELLDYSKSILERIDQKTEETKGLRDGFYSVNALREATKGTQVNEYLFVFTLMTILYLPLTFVATLYGNSIDLFNFTDASQQAAFGSAMGVVSLATYIVSFSVIWVLRRNSRRQSARTLWAATIAKLDITRLWKLSIEAANQPSINESPKAGHRLHDFGEKLRFRGRKRDEVEQNGPSGSEV